MAERPQVGGRLQNPCPGGGLSQSAEFLDRLEELESRLLGWGVVDGIFSPEEVSELADEFLRERGELRNPDELIYELFDQRLLFRAAVAGRQVVRTRMAESVRLFARLRQLFPNRAWRGAPTLVADFRFDLRSRSYPRRDIAADDLLQKIAVSGIALSDLQRRVVAELLTHEGVRRPLAGFQVRASVQVLQDLQERRSRGMIVGAGTGTGKTLSFYLPVLTSLSALVRKNSHWTKALAIYPRNELLKDQFSDTYVQARKLDTLLVDSGSRKLTIGPFFGPTPRVASEEEVERSNWPRSGDSYSCPFLRCPQCGGVLVWHRADLRSGRERLRCADRSCGSEVAGDEVVLTRERMVRETPDVLFTTTEMLNRRLTDSTFRHVFGVGADRPPRVVLLDEVHTYSGIHGAQVAYVIRRWRKAIGGRGIQFTGLSATLPNAAEFFGQLVGLTPDAVESVEPHPQEMADEGKEYQLVLRGDPASGTSLLSTTIQSVMLLRRVLDVDPCEPSHGLFGTRVFAFTDDLDVANRLYHNLLDAEGRTGNGKLKRGAFPLAALRAHRSLPGESSPGERLLAGQSWYLSEQIGHRLGPADGLNIGRTTSQDAGVGHGLDLVVATASLEVGYNDPAVGAVVQHKAPRDVASFLQRKGRAGRDRRMRPWTITVLSDYGRDRIAYQSYDQLFDPSVERRTLPVGNRHVLRMQAAFAFMDWLSLRVPHQLAQGSVWVDFSTPAYPSDLDQTRRQGWETDVIRELLESPVGELTASLAQYLQGALRIPPDEVLSLFWEPPRALMTSLLPTMLRRLEHRWGRGDGARQAPAGEAAVEQYRRYRPLPDFVPENLFSDLNLPEVEIHTPGQDKTWTMPIVQAMRTLAPGRVTRRFAPFRSDVSHWVPLPKLASGKHPLPVGDFCSEYEGVGLFQAEWDGGFLDVPCFRPWTVLTQEIPKDVLPSSNAQLVWRSQIFPSDSGAELPVPNGGGWDTIVREIRFHCHALRTHATIRRFAVGSSASVRLRSGGGYDSEVRFIDDEGRPAGVGFEQQSDGVVFLVRVPDKIGVRAQAGSAEKLRAMRASFFRDRVLSSDALDGRANVFERERLVQIYLSALTSHALRNRVDLRTASEALHDDFGTALEEVLDVIFQTAGVKEIGAVDAMSVDVASDVEDIDDAPNEEDGSPDRQRTHKNLLSLCADAEIADVLQAAAAALWEEPGDSWNEWAMKRFKATLGGALLEACYRMCPQACEGDLILDIHPGPRPPHAPPPSGDLVELWVTESTIGGGGFIEELLREYTSDPRRFLLLARSALSPSDFEIVDAELSKVLDLLLSDSGVTDIFSTVRRAKGQAELRSAVEDMAGLLTRRGVLLTHPVSSAIHTRLIRPASSEDTDALLQEVVATWRTEEERLGIDINPRIFAYVASRTAALDVALSHVDPSQRADPLWRFDVVYSLLWPRGGDVRARALSSYNPFAPLPGADRLMVLEEMQASEKHVELGGDGWREQLELALATSGVVHLDAKPHKQAELRGAVMELLGTPVDVDFLQLYPQVEGVERSHEQLSVRLHLREVVP